MSIDDLKEQHVLLPEEEWGIHELKTTVRQLPAILLFICCTAALVMTYFGAGNRSTWIGILLFFCSFFAIIILCDRAIIKQKERTKSEKEEKGI